VETTQTSELAAGKVVKVLGFKMFGEGSNLRSAKDESMHINSFVGKSGVVEFIDEDARHPIMVDFGPEAIIRRTRFAPSELEVLS
jgi:hypothetical protein